MFHIIVKKEELRMLTTLEDKWGNRPAKVPYKALVKKNVPWSEQK